MAKTIKPAQTPKAPTEAQLAKQVKSIYKDAWEESRAKMAAMYAQYGRDGKLTMADMTRYNRLSKLELELAMILKDLYKRNTKFLVDMIESAWLAGYFTQAFALEMATQRRLGFGGVDPRAIEAILSDSLTGLTLNERLTQNRTLVINKIRQGLAAGLVRGESFDKASRRIKDVLEGDAGKATMIAWTETHRANEAASHQAREVARVEHGVDYDDVWMSTFDARTRQSHRHMDGQVRGKNGFFNVNGHKARYPGDSMLPPEESIRCRCTVIQRVAGFQVTVRRGRASLDPKSKSDVFPGSWTYDEWYKSRIAVVT